MGCLFAGINSQFPEIRQPPDLNRLVSHTFGLSDRCFEYLFNGFLLNSAGGLPISRRTSISAGSEPLNVCSVASKSVREVRPALNTRFGIFPRPTLQWA